MALLGVLILSLCMAYYTAQDDEDVTPQDLKIELDKINPIERLDLFEGDIEFENEEARSAALKGETKLWPDGIVYYSIDCHLGDPMKNLIQKVLWHVQNNTCLRFVENETSPGRIHMDSLKDQCSSSFGRTGGVQPLHLGEGCGFFGTILHELLHGCGLLHEHTRSDRDDYVVIMWQNIMNEAKSQFDKRKEGDILLTDFDYDSIMIYREQAFAKKPGLKTIIPYGPGSKGKVLKGPHTKFSMTQKDIEGVNKLYNCK